MKKYNKYKYSEPMEEKMKNKNKIKILIVITNVASVFSFNKINAMEVNINKQQIPPQNITLNQTYKKHVKKEFIKY